MIRIPTRGVVLWDLDFPNETRPIIAHRDPAGLEYEYEAIVEEPNEIQWYPKSNLAALNGKLYLLDDYVCSLANPSRQWRGGPVHEKMVNLSLLCASTTLRWLILLALTVVCLCAEFQPVTRPGLGHISEKDMVTVNDLNLRLDELRLPGVLEAIGTGKTVNDYELGTFEKESKLYENVNESNKVSDGCGSREISNGKEDFAERRESLKENGFSNENKKMELVSTLIPMMHDLTSSGYLNRLVLIGLLASIVQQLLKKEPESENRLPSSTKEKRNAEDVQEAHITLETPPRNSERAVHLRDESVVKNLSTPPTVRKPIDPSKLVLSVPNDRRQLPNRCPSSYQSTFDVKDTLRGLLGRAIGESLSKDDDGNRQAFSGQVQVEFKIDGPQAPLVFQAECHSELFRTQAGERKGTKVVCKRSNTLYHATESEVNEWIGRLHAKSYKVAWDEQRKSVSILLHSVTHNAKSMIVNSCQQELEAAEGGCAQRDTVRCYNHTTTIDKSQSNGVHTPQGLQFHGTDTWPDLHQSGMLETDLCKEMAIKDGYRGKSAVEDCNKMAVKDITSCLSAVEGASECQGAGETVSQDVIHEVQEQVEDSAPKQLLQCHQQRILNLQDDIQQLKLVSAELGEGITLYKLLVRELTEGVDTKVSIKCEKNLSFVCVTTARNCVQEMVAQDYKKVMSERENLLQNQTALYAQAYQCGIPLDSAELRDNPSIRLVQHNLAVNSLCLQQIEARLVTNETTFLQQVQALKVEIMSMDPECLAVNAALAAWPTGESPKIIGSAKREGAQEQSGEGSALLSKTNNHNTTKVSAGNLLDRPRSARDVPRSRQNPTLKWAGPKGQTRSGKNQV